MSIKLIASDIDGTLLLNGATEISEKTFNLIRQLTDKGILFVVASGRQYKNLRQLFAPVKDDIAYICENGGICIYQEKIIHKRNLSSKLAFTIAEDILAHDNCELQISTSEIQYLKPKHPAFLERMQTEIGLKIKTITDLSEVTEPILKIAMYSKGGIKDAEYWQKTYGNLCVVQYGRYDWLDFAPMMTNKGNALSILIEHLHIKKQECMAFGDYYNDIGMLQTVGMPIVMDSAPEDMQKIAHHTTPTVEAEIEKLFYPSSQTQE